ncbi:TPA: hypothetical protein L4917_004767 [Pseudomonas aeruginosa]|uniref:hypothetical protein n=1 Tax=Pseudomonas aeruginosa TaxID=287 RepID=UPI0012987665|nr:hypothetical protein [Pseudomonas aeruginosa]HBO6998519.1 hypothetical protein [Pseudomonas aeruginosa]HBO7064646.1 hypothetical protein [Pseudomonas aeruginosa]HBO7158337.1 hypothetical protein [Pseudomonas aeruginosa]HBO7497968.1 hypothetical protein [Pseudomonas aeruginosa]
MSEVQRFWCHEALNIRCVREADYDALAAEAQALREEVARGNRIALAMALDIAAVGVALGIPGEQQEGGTGEFIEAIQSLQKELEALRARVVVTPDASTVYAALDARERLFTSPENIRVALEAQSRINGKTVSEGLLRRLIDSDGIDGIFDAQQNYAAHQELRALLNKDKENGNG